MSSALRPRQCILEKGANGYGFHLHGEKSKSGQFIRLVEPDSPAEASGLRAGDRLVFVGGENVETESHQQVVSRIRAAADRLELIVVDKDTDELLTKHDLKCLIEYVTEGIPLPGNGSDDGTDAQNSTPRESTPVPEENGAVPLEKKLSVSSDKEPQKELRPRLCTIKKGTNGYGFNLHSEKSKPGQYVRAVDEDSPAMKAGLRPQDRIVQVNEMSMEGKQHSDVVAAIKAGGNETSLLVVDSETDNFFKSCKTTPTEKHLTGPLPEPVTNGETEDMVNGKMAKELDTTVSHPSSIISSAAVRETQQQSAEAPAQPIPSPQPVHVPQETKVDDAAPALTLSLQQAKERARQKRSNKRAPPMDWSKRNELFSNL
ncbi:Na(+)/H(+) exchange regulatory cofactor NHE-RF1-like isoform X1 [Paramormyrops kingsleyae]|uniref:Na(+)/H(+) exchange regulatory cofactor NHE-RF n=1 Tax=Paramormyrops kingsleyae TaxID=1676925 RepID=A0A3B3S7U8_9TELE|nr:Na(+)/H(+) exchange regulatory cofactor NHE-RF1-like isoform X1 [Paramormyrops kingsleyae]